jgi:hypothetical protein
MEFQCFLKLVNVKSGWYIKLVYSFFGDELGSDEWRGSAEEAVPVGSLPCGIFSCNGM